MTLFWIVFAISLLFCTAVAEALMLSLAIQEKNKYKEIAESYTMELDPIEIADPYEPIWTRNPEDAKYWGEHWD